MPGRLHLFELEDQPWFPAVVRDLATDYLHFLQQAVKLEGALVPLLAKALEDTGERRIVDLCSGGSGPLPALIERLRARGLHVTATLTDLYPNIAAFEAIAERSGGAIGFAREPVDARAVPATLPGMRTIFNGFHHLRPDDARAVLQAAAAARQPIGVFEVSERSIRTLPVLLTPLFVLIATPFMRPFRWRRLFWTYLVPLVPLTCLWDGVVSQLRAYTVPELRQLVDGAAGMTWSIGQIPIAKGRARLTYVLGAPAR